MFKISNIIINTIDRYCLHKYFETGNTNNVYKLGRWGNKTHKQKEIAEYWTNIDHCGDKVCGNLKETKDFYEKEILKIKK
jgi:hypothetical protein